MKENKYPVVNYIGNKQKIVDWIVSNLPIKNGKIIDLFSGGASVSYALKKKGYTVYSNDILYSNYVLARALIENSKETLDKSDFDLKIAKKDINKQFNKIEFLVNLIYFDYEVKELAELSLIASYLPGNKKHLFLSLLRRAMIRKIPYSRMNIKWTEIMKFRDEEYSYKKYGRYRSYHNKTFSFHIDDNINSYNSAVFDNGKKNKAYQKDAFELLEEIEAVDMIYIDPPYPSTMNNYFAFYGYFDDIFDKKIIPSFDFTNSNYFTHFFTKLLSLCYHKTKYIIISLNNKTKPGKKEILKLVEKHFVLVDVLTKNHVYKVTGKNNKNENHEILIVAKRRDA